MFLFTNKKVMGLLSSDVRCIKKSKVFKKTVSENITNINHFHLVLICIDFTAKYKIRQSIFSV